jgi:hypothetical protein
MVFYNKSILNKRKKNTEMKTKKIGKTKIQKKTLQSLKKSNSSYNEFPYYKNYITKGKLLIDVQKLANYQPIFLKYNPVSKRINKFNNKLIIFKEGYEKNKKLYQITDYFSQSCRVRCLNNLKSKETPLEFFQKNKDKIYKELKGNITYPNISEYLYRNTKQCTNFNTTVVLSLLKFLNVKRYLDPSAGWGDRLIAAIAYDCEYTGVDPSNCMNPIYKQMIEELVPTSEQSKYEIIKSGFEDAIIKKNHYDLVFTSPPFFDFELYEKDKGQSVEKFNTLEIWLSGFLFPLIDKSYQALKINGHFGIYISDYTGISFTDEMFKYIREKVKGFKYQGDIHFWTPENEKVIRTIFFWQKIV